MEDKNTNTEYLCNLKQERDEILEHKYRGAVIRSKLPIMQENPTKAFLSIESSIQKSRVITEISDPNEDIVTNVD